MPTLEVRPLSISCLCRNKLTRARPRPSSNWPGMWRGRSAAYETFRATYLGSRHPAWWTCRCLRCRRPRTSPPGSSQRLAVVIVIIMPPLDGLSCCRTVTTSIRPIEFRPMKGGGVRALAYLASDLIHQSRGLLYDRLQLLHSPGRALPFIVVGRSLASIHPGGRGLRAYPEDVLSKVTR